MFVHLHASAFQRLLCLSHPSSPFRCCCSRRVNDGQNFAVPFLDTIFHSIAAEPLRLDDDTAAISAASWLHKAKLAATPRGTLVTMGPTRGALDRHMFQLIWQPAVHAISVVLEYADSSTMTDLALTGACCATTIDVIADFH